MSKEKIEISYRNPFNLTVLVCRIVNSILRPAGLTVPNGNHPGGMVYHPLVPPLETTLAVSRADVAHQVCSREDCVVAILPTLLPPPLKALVWAGAN